MAKWIVNGKYDFEEDLIDVLLEGRGITTKQDKAEFINPPPISTYIKNLPVEFKKNLKTTKSLVEGAIKSNIPIVIHGDYDADGICATAILYNALYNELRYERTIAFIPNRFEHGYGLSMNSVEALLTEVSEQFPDFSEMQVSDMRGSYRKKKSGKLSLIAGRLS